MKKQVGFTVIELLSVVVFFAIAIAVLFVQLRTIDTRTQTEQQKTAINAIYYSLEEGFYATHGYYPESIDEKTLPTMDSELLSDPMGAALGEPGSTYHYDPTDCHEQRCKAYTLRTSLVGEADFVKESRHK